MQKCSYTFVSLQIIHKLIWKVLSNCFSCDVLQQQQKWSKIWLFSILTWKKSTFKNECWLASSISDPYKWQKMKEEWHCSFQNYKQTYLFVATQYTLSSQRLCFFSIHFHICVVCSSTDITMLFTFNAKLCVGMCCVYEKISTIRHCSFFN